MPSIEPNPGLFRAAWMRRIDLKLAGFSELKLDEVAAQTEAVANNIAGEQYDQT
jgi:hypothetical protein